MAEQDIAIVGLLGAAFLAGFLTSCEGFNGDFYSRGFLEEATERAGAHEAWDEIGPHFREWMRIRGLADGS